jgi:hypothetical protein
MPSLDELEQGLARLTTTYKSISITFEYHPDRVGMNLQRAIASVTRPPYDMGPICDELALVLSAWDLTRNGEPIPTTAEGLCSLPMGISSAIGREIMEDFHDPKSPLTPDQASASSTSSLAGSQPADSATAQTSPTSSSEPNGQASIPLPSPASPIRVDASSGPVGSASS